MTPGTRGLKSPLQAKACSTEQGFALLLIFVLAASVAIMLYLQMPRVAFESERDKEQLLITRGEQYKRAIQLFYAENRRFPARIEDLENTNNHRYLRHRYIDPYTGKDEWRLIHTNGMFLTDSLVQKPPANPANSSSGTTQGQTLTAGAAPPTGTIGTQPPNSPPNAAQTPVPNSTNPNVPQPVNAAVLTRPSDRPITQAGGFAGVVQQPTQPLNSGYVDPASYPPITLFPNGYNASTQPGQPNQAGVQPGGQFQPGVQPGFQPGFQPGAQPGFQPGVQPGFQSGIQPGFPPQQPFKQGQFQPGIPQPGQFQPGVQPQPLPFNQFPNPADPNTIQNGQLSAQSFPVPQTGTPGSPVPGLNPNFANQFPQNQFPQNQVPQDQFPQNQPPQNQAPNPLVPTQLPFPQNNPPNPVQQPQFPVPTQVSNNPANNPSANGAPPAPPNQALNMINQILTTPRQPPPGVGPGTGNQPTVGGGIAGVASTFTGPTIKSYAEKTKFEEWEFVFQLQQQGVPGQGANPLQNGAQNNGANPNP